MKHIKLFEEFVNELISPQHPVTKLLVKHWSLASAGNESARWAYQKDHCPAEEKASFESLERRDLAAAEDGKVKAAKIAERINKMSKDFDEPTMDFIQYHMTDYVEASKKRGLAYKALFGAEQSCEKFNMGCKNVKRLEAEYKKVQAEFEKVEKELEAKRAAAGATWKFIG